MVSKVQLKLVKDDLKLLLPELEKKLTKDGVFLLLNELGNEYIIQIHLRAPIRTGQYVDSYESTITPQTMSIFTSMPELAEHLEFGTAPHIIRPKDPNGVLHWVNSLGEDVFAKSVNHPGNRPYPHIRQTIEHIRSIIGTKAKQVMRELNV